MAVLGEDEGEVGGFEMVAEVEDVGEGGGGHVEEDMLHVDYEQDGGHCARGGRVVSSTKEAQKSVVAEYNGRSKAESKHGASGIVA